MDCIAAHAATSLDRVTLFARNIVKMYSTAISHSAQRLPARLTYMLLSMAAAVLAVWLAWHYPLGGFAAVAAVLGVGAAMFWRPWLWLLAVPALLPLIGWAPWSGWVTFEELDLLVVTSAAAGYARLALMPIDRAAYVQTGLGTSKSAAFGWMFVLLFSASTLWAMGRGFEDAGGFVFGWFQGYMEPMNSVRVGKALFLALLLWPLWRAQSQPAVLFSVGMAAGLAGVALTTMWERTAFVGLMNFASDYRTTGMFWEMHVGGAALDGYLALTVPFAVQQLMVARKPAHWVGAGLALGLGLYACLTTFSRGVYLALPVGLMVMLWLSYRQQGRLVVASDHLKWPHSAGDDRLVTVRSNEMRRAIQAGVIVVVCFAVAVAWVFPTSGYRGALAVMGTLVALLALAHWVRRIRLAALVGGGLLGGVLSAAMVGAYAVVPKSSYLSFALAFLGCMGAVALARRHVERGTVQPVRRSSRAASLGMGCFVGAVAGTGLIFLHWGEAPALSAGLPVLGLLLLTLVAVGMVRQPLWPNTLRWQAVVAGCMLMVLTVVGVFSGGDYISNRFSTGRDDLGGRVAHWLQGLDMLADRDDLNWGKGMGRYPANYYMSGPRDERVGDYRLVASEMESYLALSGGLHSLRGGALFRVSQRVGVPAGKVVLNFDVKAAQDVGLTFEVCTKHLLYTDYACLDGQVGVKAKPNEWQHLELPMVGTAVSRGNWFAPKLIVFSAAITTNGAVAALDNLHLQDAKGTDLLANGDFSNGLAHWFTSSDRNHMPWHIKSLPMNVVFDQGLVGLALLLSLLTVALWRLSWGAGRDHALAPATAGAIVGFGVVGLFDSLLDVPRVAFLFYYLVLLALSVKGQRGTNGKTKLPAATELAIAGKVESP